MKTRTEQARAFLGSLLGPIPEGTCVELRVKRNDEKGTRQAFLASYDQLDVSRYTPVEHVWYGVSFRRAGTSKGRAEDVVSGRVIWADFDHVEDRDAAAAKLARFTVPPTAIVDSGGGVHAYWRLNQLLDLTDETQRTYLREVVHGLATQLGADVSVHDPSRVLRVPQTFNGGNGRTKVYDPPREVRVLHADFGRVYGVGDLARFRRPLVDSAPATSTKEAAPVPREASEAPPVDQLRVSNKVRSYIKLGAGNEDRSSVDMKVMTALAAAGYADEEIYALFAAHPIGKKAREKGNDSARYLQLTLTNARQYLEAANAPRVAEIRERGGCLEAPRGKGFEVVYNRRMVAVAKLDGDAPGYHVRIEGGDAPVVRTLPVTAFATNVDWKKALNGAGSWMGSDRDVQLMIQYLDDQKPPLAHAVRSIGWHGSTVVFPNASLVGDQLVTATDYVYTGKFHNAKLIEPAAWQGLAHELSEIIPVLHGEGPMMELTGWFSACFIAPQLRKLTGGVFPICMVFGVPESGKTTILEIMRRLHGLDAALHSSNDTKLANIELISGSNTLPVVFDEHRPADVKVYKSNLYPVLREAYNGGIQSRGRPDLTVTRYHLSAPVAIGGEMPFRDPALLDRTIHVRFDRSGKNPLAYGKLGELVLEEFAAGMYAHARTKEVRTLWAEANRLLPGLFTDNKLHHRQRLAWTAVACGLLLWEPFWSRDQIRSWIHGFEATKVALADDIVVSTKAVVHEIVRCLLELMKARRIKEGQEYVIRSHPDEMLLWIVPSLVLPLIEEYYQRVHTDLPMGRETMLGRMREDAVTDNPVVRHFKEPLKIGGRAIRGVSFDLLQVERELEIPTSVWRNETVENGSEM